MINNITRLIARHNCVILPEMGAFLAHDVPAAYNAEEQIFMPPHRTLGFNPQVTVDDALLLSEYLNNATLSYEDARNLLEQDVARLRYRLSRKGTLRFGELGTFSMDINSEITFEPCSNCIDDPKNFGFEPLAIPLLSKCEKRDIVIKRSDFSRYVAAAAAIILAFIFVTPVSDSAYKSGMQASFAGKATGNKSISTVMVEAPIASVRNEVCEIVPITDTTTESIITTKESEPVATVEHTPAEVSLVTTEVETHAENKIAKQDNTARYHIIVASLPSAKSAKIAIKELSYKMKTDYSVVERDRRFRISVAGFDCETDANAALVEVKKTFPDAWILAR